MVWGIDVRKETPPLKFEIGSVLRKLRRISSSVEGVTLKLPLIDVSVKVDRQEKKIAREVVLRVSDRRVLSSFECCDDCIESSIHSIQEIRKFILDKQAELVDLQDGPLYNLLDAIRLPIRQFTMFEEKLKTMKDGEKRRAAYFRGLEILRDHIHRTLNQIAAIGGTKVPASADYMRYDDNWRLEAYDKPEFLDKANSGALIKRKQRRK